MKLFMWDFMYCLPENQNIAYLHSILKINVDKTYNQGRPDFS